MVARPLVGNGIDQIESSLAKKGNQINNVGINEINIEGSSFLIFACMLSIIFEYKCILI